MYHTRVHTMPHLIIYPYNLLHRLIHTHTHIRNNHREYGSATPTRSAPLHPISAPFSQAPRLQLSPRKMPCGDKFPCGWGWVNEPRPATPRCHLAAPLSLSLPWVMSPSDNLRQEPQTYITSLKGHLMNMSPSPKLLLKKRFLWGGAGPGTAEQAFCTTWNYCGLETAFLIIKHLVELPTLLFFVFHLCHCNLWGLHSVY